jgi:integral membrane sensor domain MASE1
VTPAPPKEYKNAGIALLVAGLTNAVFAAGWASILLCLCIGYLWLIPFGFACLEAVSGYTMMEGQPRPNAKLIAIFGLCVSAFLLNPISFAAEIVTLVLLTNDEVEAWMRGDE